MNPRKLFAAIHPLHSGLLPAPPGCCWHLSCIDCCTGFTWEAAAKARIDRLEPRALPP